ncbi:MAG: phosphopentomutase [Clostridiaceae bacterium]
MAKRAILIVLDSVGIGAMPDAAEFGDAGSHTLGNIYKARGRLDLPNLYRLGLSRIADARLPIPAGAAEGSYGRAAEVTKAKDTTCGHWEMAGIIMDKPFKTFPGGFPADFMKEYEHRIGRGTLFNGVASGTAIINELGDEHVKTGKPIVYTSADSVFQVAAHEEVIPLDELYSMCKTAREMLHGDYLVGRVIARPFVGVSGAYTRTENRRDYAIPPVSETILDSLYEKGIPTVAIGKIEDIFDRRGISVIDHAKNNHTGFAATLKQVQSDVSGLIFTNLVDFDMLYGHRNDVEGYASALEWVDENLPQLLNAMRDDDMLIITADHGCDPTTASTDHSREYIPVVVYGKRLKGGVDLGTLHSFSDIGSTIHEYLTGSPFKVGRSFLPLIEK